jgi:peptidyl-Lys metalloendopeptidase
MVNRFAVTKLVSSLALSALAALASSASYAGPRYEVTNEEAAFTSAELRTQVSNRKAFHAAGDAVAVTVNFSNASYVDARVPAWLADASNPDLSFLRVTRDGVELPYQGAIAKRLSAEKQTHIELQPGESFSVSYKLDRAFDMSEGGVYEVSFVGSEKHIVGGRSFDSLPASLWVEADASRSLVPDSRHRVNEKLGVSSYAASCTSSQRSALATALNSAVVYANDAVSYLSATPSSSKTRYVTWFGSVTTNRWNTVKSHFANIKSTFDNQNMSFDCGCTDAGTFAYVYPTQPYKVYLCGAFWSAPNTGTDSRAGTLVHETSHFNVVAGTKDNAYGQSAAKSLARSNPTKAVANADSHEYFAENNPFQN